MKTKTIILDTDIGYDPDDLFALILLLQLAQDSVKLIVTASECDLKRLSLLNMALKTMGADDIRTCAGKSLGLNKFTVDALIEDVPTPTESKDYLEEMYAVVTTNEDPVLYIGLGGFTNLASFIKKYPDEAQKMECFLMGGALDYERHPEWIEFNIRIDPEAADYVVKSGLDISMIMAQTTHDPVYEVTWTSDLYEKLKASNEPINQLLGRHCDLWYERREYKHGTSMHDPLTVAVALGYDFVTLKEAKISLKEGKFIHDEAGFKIKYSLPSSRSADFMEFLEGKLL